MVVFPRSLSAFLALSVALHPAKTQTMRIFSIIPALAALVTAVASVSVYDTCAGSEMRHETHVAPKRGFIEHPSCNVHSMTNAELLRRELPLNRPVLRRGTFVTSSTEIYTRSGLTQMEVRFFDYHSAFSSSPSFVSQLTPTNKCGPKALGSTSVAVWMATTTDTLRSLLPL